MKTCSYCGKQYPDSVMVCAADQQPLFAEGKASRKIVCPQCGESENLQKLQQSSDVLRMFAVVFGGLLATILRLVSRPKKMRCNRCRTEFLVQDEAYKGLTAAVWILVILGILIFLAVAVAAIFGFGEK